MAITSLHVRFLWGAFDLDTEEGVTPAYLGTTQYAEMGPTAAQGDGIGARRLTIVLDTGNAPVADDVRLVHFDFINITSGAPDDSWITSDYTTIEALLTTWWAAIVSDMPQIVKMSRLLWHRIGPGVALPNPAERIVDVTTPVAGTSTTAPPPQCATNLTFRTGMRRHWGRTYLPIAGSSTQLQSVDGRLVNACADRLVAATVTFLRGCATADFHPVVVGTLGAFGVEIVEMDNTIDIQRRRRWKHTTYRKLTTL